jgi:ER lumen protein retaining receptor
LKSQELYLIVFITRYLDIFTVFYSLYNSIMKVFFISSTAVIIYLLKCSERWHTSYNPTHDNFLHWRYIMLPTFGLGWLTHFIWGRNLNLMEGLWCVSIYLEAVAMLPQLIMFRSDRILKGNQGDVKDEILLPIFLLGIYRGLYIINWIYRAITERNYRHHLVVYTCGIVQVLLYSSFFKV